MYAGQRRRRRHPPDRSACAWHGCYHASESSIGRECLRIRAVGRVQGGEFITEL